jgi:uncharacterized membrane protein YgdD (TMEM256/DUF423 family)
MRVFIFIGALFCFLGVVAGALGAHALTGLLQRTAGAGNYQLATDYMFYHGLGLIAVGIVKGRGHPAPVDLAGWLLFVGSILFQGNLYLIALAEMRSFQALTPIGGICLMAGWLALAAAATRSKAGRGA